METDVTTRQEIAESLIPKRNGIDRFLYIYNGDDARLLKHLPLVGAPPLAEQPDDRASIRRCPSLAGVTYLRPLK
jgi:hypothetical protein